jgi:hypothetical protein
MGAQPETWWRMPYALLNVRAPIIHWPGQMCQAGVAQSSHTLQPIRVYPTASWGRVGLRRGSPTKFFRVLPNGDCTKLGQPFLQGCHAVWWGQGLDVNGRVGVSFVVV